MCADLPTGSTSIVRAFPGSQGLRKPGLARLRPTRPPTRCLTPGLGEQMAVSRERGEQRVDILVHVVEVERDAEVRVALRADDPGDCEGVDQRCHVGRLDADERATAL